MIGSNRLPDVEVPNLTDATLMVVGTPRSGTTLLQRLVADATALPTVPETHLFTAYAPRLAKSRVEFPLAGSDLVDALERYVRMPQHGVSGPSSEALFDLLQGRAGSLIDVFRAVLTEFSGSAPHVIEKTPDHLLWLGPLAASLPATKFVSIVRDPRSVIASTKQVHWGQQNVVMAAERWRRDQQHLLAMRRRLGPNRLLIVRYEDLVADEQATAELVVGFCSEGLVNAGAAQERTANVVYRGHEDAWKRRAMLPATDDRVDRWHDELTPPDIARIEAVTGPMMRQFGYQPSTSGEALDPRSRLARAQYAVRRAGHDWKIQHLYAPRAGLGRP